MHAEMDMRNTTLVIGAGPAGLAAAGELRRAGVPAFVLERADAIGASWRGRYDRLRLNTSRLTSRLPKTRYPRGTALFIATRCHLGEGNRPSGKTSAIAATQMNSVGHARSWMSTAHSPPGSASGSARIA
jgi:cation diffusion facilitator CzcD-associated flavoprotein CzcO